MGELKENSFETLKNAIENELELLLQEKKRSYEKLFEAARYSTLGGGKRIRPLLMIATADLFNVPLKISLQPACALEMIHTYSLIHDDLPCMDDDDFRRGRPTLHKVYGEAIATLTGDFLLTYAFELLSQSPHLTDSQKIALIKKTARASGGEGMIGGQVLDLHEGEKSIEELYRLKTGELISLAVQSGGILANIGEKIQTQLKEFGDKLGILFQLCDDIADGDGPYSPLVAKEKAFKLYDEILNLLDKIAPNATFLKFLTEKVLKISTLSST